MSELNINLSFQRSFIGWPFIFSFLIILSFDPHPSRSANEVTSSYDTRLSPCTHVHIPEKHGNEDTFSQCYPSIFWLFFKPFFFFYTMSSSFFIPCSGPCSWEWNMRGIGVCFLCSMYDLEFASQFAAALNQNKSSPKSCLNKNCLLCGLLWPRTIGLANQRL